MNNNNLFGQICFTGMLFMVIGGFMLLFSIYNFQYTQKIFPIIFSTILFSIGISGLIIGFMNLNGEIGE